MNATIQQRVKNFETHDHEDQNSEPYVHAVHQNSSEHKIKKQKLSTPGVAVKDSKTKRTVPLIQKQDMDKAEHISH